MSKYIKVKPSREDSDFKYEAKYQKATDSLTIGCIKVTHTDMDGNQMCEDGCTGICYDGPCR